MPKKMTRGMRAMMPMSPTTHSSWCSTQRRMTVASVTKHTNHCVDVNFSFVGRTGLMVIPRSHE